MTVLTFSHNGSSQILAGVFSGATLGVSLSNKLKLCNQYRPNKVPRYLPSPTVHITKNTK